MERPASRRYGDEGEQRTSSSFFTLPMASSLSLQVLRGAPPSPPSWVFCGLSLRFCLCVPSVSSFLPRRVFLLACLSGRLLPESFHTFGRLSFPSPFLVFRDFSVYVEKLRERFLGQGCRLIVEERTTLGSGLEKNEQAPDTELLASCSLSRCLFLSCLVSSEGKSIFSLVAHFARRPHPPLY